MSRTAVFFIHGCGNALEHSFFAFSGKLYEVNEVAELKSCNNTIFFEARKHKDLYLWISRCPQGPSIKFLVQNVHTMAEIKLTGNCLKGSRPIVCFDKNFDAQAPTTLIREVISQVRCFFFF